MSNARNEHWASLHKIWLYTIHLFKNPQFRKVGVLGAIADSGDGLIIKFVVGSLGFFVCMTFKILFWVLLGYFQNDVILTSFGGLQPFISIEHSVSWTLHSRRLLNFLRIVTRRESCSSSSRVVDGRPHVERAPHGRGMHCGRIRKNVPLHFLFLGSWNFSNWNLY